jgi:hypothetical protein
MMEDQAGESGIQTQARERYRSPGRRGVLRMERSQPGKQLFAQLSKPGFCDEALTRWIANEVGIFGKRRANAISRSAGQANKLRHSQTAGALFDEDL